MFIRSERLFLRPIWPEDWQDLLAGIGDEAVVRKLAQAPWPYAADEARFSAGSSPAMSSQNRHCPQFLVTRPRGDNGVDAIGVIGLAKAAGEVALCYWIASEHWGRGYATEAVRALLSLARTLGHRRLIARHFLDDPASARVLAKLGFCPRGEVVETHSLVRGGMALAQEHVLDLVAASNCDDFGGDPGGVALGRFAA